MPEEPEIPQEDTTTEEERAQWATEAAELENSTSPDPDAVANLYKAPWNELVDGEPVAMHWSLDPETNTVIPVPVEQ